MYTILFESGGGGGREEKLRREETDSYTQSNYLAETGGGRMDCIRLQMENLGSFLECSLIMLNSLQIGNQRSKQREGSTVVPSVVLFFCLQLGISHLKELSKPELTTCLSAMVQSISLQGFIIPFHSVCESRNLW